MLHSTNILDRVLCCDCAVLCWPAGGGREGREAEVGEGGGRGQGGAVFVLNELGGSEEEGGAKVSLLASWVKVGLAASVSDSALSWSEVSMVEVSKSLS